MQTVTARIVSAYADLTGRQSIARCGTMQFNRIEIGVATEHLRESKRLMAANVEKAREISRLRVEIADANKELSAKKQSLSQMTAKFRQATDEVERLKHSESYRLGLFLTWPLRKIYRMFCNG